MKTLQEVFDEVEGLDQIESRIAIPSLPFIINSPGSYYLTGNLSSTGDGITITASSVTLDLNGFNLQGSGSADDMEGIRARGGVGLEIKNGSITGFGNSIELHRVKSSSVKNVHCSGSNGPGIFLSGDSSECDGNSISRCHVSNAGTAGIQLSGKCNGNSVTHCQVTDCTIVGILVTGSLDDASGNVIANNIVGNITGSSSTYGIQLLNAEGNRVIGNHVSGISSPSSTSFGIYSSGGSPGNFIINNSCSGSDDNFSFDPEDTRGPEFTVTGTIISTNPWANFSR